MKKEFEKIVILFKKACSACINKQEQAELDELLKDEQWQSAYRQLQDDNFISQKLSEYTSYSHEKAFAKFAQKTSKCRRRNSYVLISLVAAMALFAFILIFMPEPDNKSIKQKTVVENAIIPPGSPKAQIKLADGSMVNVTGTNMQIRENEGALIACQNGQITYEQKEKIARLVYNELIVPLAGECYIVLDDGTKVWVNSDTRLKYPVRFVGNERKVYLEGEAYFEVKKDTKPFIVHTALGEVNVLGTSFGVKAYKDENNAYTTLVTGKVRFVGEDSMEINAGEQVIASLSGKLEKRVVDVMEFVGWKEGVYVFKKQPVEVIMKNLSRWYNIDVFYQNQKIRDIEFTGNLKRYDNVNTFMEILARTGDIKFKINGNTIILFQ